MWYTYPGVYELPVGWQRSIWLHSKCLSQSPYRAYPHMDGGSYHLLCTNAMLFIPTAYTANSLYIKSIIQGLRLIHGLRKSMQSEPHPMGGSYAPRISYAIYIVMRGKALCTWLHIKSSTKVRNPRRCSCKGIINTEGFYSISRRPLPTAARHGGG